MGEIYERKWLLTCSLCSNLGQPFSDQPMNVLQPSTIKLLNNLFFFLVLQLLNIHTWLLNFFLGLGAPWVIHLPILTHLLNYIPNLPTSNLPIIFHQPTYCNLHIYQFISYVHTYLLPTYIPPSTCLKGMALLIIGIIDCNLDL
jgi:hypothetical protein